MLFDLMRERLDFEGLKVRAVHLRKRWKPERVIVEDSANGSALVQDLRRHAFCEFNTMKVSEPKEARFAVAAEWLQSERIWAVLNQPRSANTIRSLKSRKTFMTEV